MIRERDLVEALDGVPVGRRELAAMKLHGERHVVTKTRIGLAVQRADEALPGIDCDWFTQKTATLI